MMPRVAPQLCAKWLLDASAQVTEISATLRVGHEDLNMPRRYPSEVRMIFTAP